MKRKERQLRERNVHPVPHDVMGGKRRERKEKGRRQAGEGKEEEKGEKRLHGKGSAWEKRENSRGKWVVVSALTFSLSLLRLFFVLLLHKRLPFCRLSRNIHPPAQVISNTEHEQTERMMVRDTLCCSSSPVSSVIMFRFSISSFVPYLVTCRY